MVGKAEKGQCALIANWGGSGTHWAWPQCTGKDMVTNKKD